MIKGLVTVGIPAYKADYLHETIRSVLSQTYADVEIVIVNDDSPEDIEEVVAGFTDDRIRYYKNPRNLGKDNPALNWNRCLELANGEFFSLLCDDDRYAPDFIEQMLNLSVRYPECNVFRARGCITDGNGVIVERYPSSPGWETVEDYMWHVFKGFRKQTISEFMYRTNHIRHCGGYAYLPLAWHADYLSIYRIALRGGIATADSDRILLLFRLSGKNISSKDRCNTFEKILATGLYCKEVKTICQGNSFVTKEEIVRLLANHVKAHNKWFLKKATFRELLRVLKSYRQLELPLRLVLKSFFRH